jgi:hypothetical protein
MIAATQPWWPHLFDWPRFLDPISWWWLSVKGYALTSSWFQVAWIVGGLLLLRHHNCHVTGCPWIGHPVEGTSHKACRVRGHHPHLAKTRTTAEDIARAARYGHNTDAASSE